MITQKVIKIPIFLVDLRIVVVDDMKECLEIDSRVDTTSDSCVVDYGNGKVTIFIKGNDISIIAHECFHAKNSVWCRIGYKPQVGNDEVDAYLLEYIVQEVMKVVDKHNAK